MVRFFPEICEILTTGHSLRKPSENHPQTKRLLSTIPSYVQPTPKNREGRRCRAASSIRPPPCGAGRAGPPGLTRQPYFSRKAVAGFALPPAKRVSPRITTTSPHLGAHLLQDFAFSHFSQLFARFLRKSKFLKNKRASGVPEVIRERSGGVLCAHHRLVLAFFLKN